jgi:hypothetical protein
VAWRNLSFQAYADYMASRPFLDALDQLVTDACERHVAVMCSESEHRRLVGGERPKGKGVGAENVVQAVDVDFRRRDPHGEDGVVALSFLYLAFIRLLQLVRLSFREQEELAIEVVMLRHEVSVLRRQVARPA